MRVLHVTHSISGGGAGVAAYRIFDAVRKQPGIEAHMITTTPLPTNVGESSIEFFRPRNQRLNHLAESTALHLQKSINSAHRTLGIFDSGLADHILSSNWDLVHLHWVGLGTLSINEIGRLSHRIPTVWTLHDSWPFCGAEHHPYFKEDLRFVEGYPTGSRHAYDSYVDVDREVFRRKWKAWRAPIGLVAPTSFMADSARASFMAEEWPIAVIPHPINTTIYRDKGASKRKQTLTSAGLSPAQPTLLFVSSGGSDSNKGLDLLEKMLVQARQLLPTLQVVTIGGPWPEVKSATVQLPQISDEHTLSEWYSAVDLVAVTSRIESFSLVAAEAQACGCSVVAFDTTGLSDVVGLICRDNLVRKWAVEEMAERAVTLLLQSRSNSAELEKEAKLHWDPQSVGASYVSFGRSLVDSRVQSSFLKGSPHKSERKFL